jgi:phosphatidylethanolamine-binding protein (PEBP) family uncharacterized protein
LPNPLVCLLQRTVVSLLIISDRSTYRLSDKLQAIRKARSNYARSLCSKLVPASLKMRLFPALCLALIPSAAAWDSRNVSASEWICNAFVGVTFGAIPVDCSTEILQNVAQTQPVIRYYNASAAVGSLYTVIIVDRDAPSAGSPVRSPLRHFSAGNIADTVLADGVEAGIAAWFNYSGPQPPAGSLCHRYYVMVYHQTPGISPTLQDPTQRLLWDFPAWARNNSLTKVAVNYWQTQNLSVRAVPCDAGGGGGASGSSSLSEGAVIGIAVGVLIAVGAAIFCAVRWRRSCAQGGKSESTPEYVAVS